MPPAPLPRIVLGHRSSPPQTNRTMLRIVGAIVGVLVLAGIVVALLGARLPVAHVATRTIVLPAPPESVFATITDFRGSTSWRTDLKAVEVVPVTAGAKPRYTEVSGTGSMTVEVEELSPPRRLVTRIAGEGLPFGGAWAFQVQAEGDGCLCGRLHCRRCQ